MWSFFRPTAERAASDTHPAVTSLRRIGPTTTSNSETRSGSTIATDPACPYTRERHPYSQGGCLFRSGRRRSDPSFERLTSRPHGYEWKKACSRMTRMSESYYPSPDSFPSDVSSTATAQRSRGPQLGLACVAVGLGILLGIVVAALIFVLVGIGSAAGWSAIGAVGFVIGAAFTALAVSSYRRPEPVRWWQILGFSFGVGLLVNSINRAARAEPVSVIVGILNAASLVLLIVGGIVAVIQTSAKPAAKPPPGGTGGSDSRTYS